MGDSSQRHSVIRAERDLLQRLCQTGIRALDADLQRVLGRYCWMGQDHRTIFEALVRLERVPASSLRERLPAEATRMGFPDIHWEMYFEEPHKPQSDEPVAELIGQLIGGSANSQ